MTETSSASGSSMNTSTTDQARLVIVGATGMVGGYALRYALEHAAVGTVTAIGRRKLDISHRKLREVLHQDFMDCSAVGRGTPQDHRGLYDRAYRYAHNPGVGGSNPTSPQPTLLLDQETLHVFP